MDGWADIPVKFQSESPELNYLLLYINSDINSYFSIENYSHLIAYVGTFSPYIDKMYDSITMTS